MKINIQLPIWISLLISAGTCAQHLEPLENGIPCPLNFPNSNGLYSVYSDNQTISVLFYKEYRGDTVFKNNQVDTIYRQDIYQISEWKNNHWDSITSLTFRSARLPWGPQQYSLKKIGQSYYLRISIQHFLDEKASIDGLPKTQYNLIRYSDGAWQPIVPSVLDPLDTLSGSGVHNQIAPGLEEENNTLYYLDLLKRGKSYRYCLFRYNNGNWDTLPAKLPSFVMGNGPQLLLIKDFKGLYIANQYQEGLFAVKGDALVKQDIPRIADNSLVYGAGGEPLVYSENYAS